MGNIITIQDIDTALIDPSPVNQRHFDLNGLKEFAESIKRRLIHEPVVRPIPDGRFEIVAGERRIRAMKILGIPAPCKVVEMTDQEAHRITATENFEREDLAPMEESASVAVLSADGLNQKQIADAIGKSEHWVRTRLLIDSMSEKWKALAQDQESVFHEWKIGHWLSIARMPIEIQESMLTNSFRNGDFHSDISLSGLRQIISNQMMIIKNAKPKIINAIGNRPACQSCAMRTGANLDLFDDIVDLDDDDKCLNKNCFDEKRALHLKAVLGKQEDKHGNKLQKLNSSYSYKTNLLPDDDEALKGSTDYDYYGYLNKCKKSDTGAVPFIILDGNNPGKIGWHIPKKTANPETGKFVKTLDERRQDLRGRRAKKLITKVLASLDEVIKAGRTKENQLSSHITDEQAMAMICSFRVNKWEKAEMSYTSHLDVFKYYNRTLKVFSDNNEENRKHAIQDAVFRSLPYLRGTLQEQLNQNVCYMKPKSAHEVALILGMDPEQMAAEIEKSTPVPKAWAKLNEDGTPKVKEKKEPVTSDDDKAEKAELSNKEMQEHTITAISHLFKRGTRKNLNIVRDETDKQNRNPSYIFTVKSQGALGSVSYKIFQKVKAPKGIFSQIKLGDKWLDTTSLNIKEMYQVVLHPGSVKK